MKQINWKRSAAALGLTLALTIPAVGAASNAPVGTVVDHVLYTDIVAKIDNLPIPSYNINGYTVVAAEDLLDYGFDVVWNGEARTLDITLNTAGKEVTADYVPQVNTHPIGAIAGDVLSTDIVTWVTDYWGVAYEIPSWNIGGKTVVLMDDLAKAFGFHYEFDTNRELSFMSKRYTAWRREIPISEQTNELKQGFALKLTKSEDGKTFQIEGEGEWGAVDNLSVSSNGVSFSVYQRVTDTSALSGLDAVAVYDPIRDNIPQNRKENSDWRRAELKNRFWVCIDGIAGEVKEGELWLGHGNGHTDYQFRFDLPSRLEELHEIYIAVGDVFWVADRSISYLYESSCSSFSAFYNDGGTCETYATELAHVYSCRRSTAVRWDDDALYVVWADGTRMNCLAEFRYLRWYDIEVSPYYVDNITFNEDETAFTFQWMVYETQGKVLSPDFTIEKKGMGTWRVDLVTKEMTLESIGDEENPSLPEALPNVMFRGLEFNPYGGSHGSQVRLQLAADGEHDFRMEADTSMVKIQSFDFFSQFPGLASLEISGGTVHSFQGIEQLESLETLVLVGCKLEETVLPAMPNLKQVYLGSETKVDAESFLKENPQAVLCDAIPDFLKSAAAITWERDWEQGDMNETAAWCDLSELDRPVSLDLAKLPELRYLSVYGCSSPAYAPFLQAAGLKRVSFFDCEIDGVPVGAGSEGITRLTFEHCTVNSLSGIEQWTGLKEVSFTECELGPGCSLEALAGQGNLNVLWE